MSGYISFGLIRIHARKNDNKFVYQLLTFLLTGDHLGICNSVSARNYKMSRWRRSPASLPHPSTVSEAEGNLYLQLVHGHCGLPQTPAVLNPNRVILVVDHKTQKVFKCYTFT